MKLYYVSDKRGNTKFTTGQRGHTLRWGRDFWNVAFPNDGVNTVLYAAARNGPVIFFKIGVKVLYTGTVAMLSVCTV
jgi:hypothetical protein